MQFNGITYVVQITVDISQYKCNQSLISGLERCAMLVTAPYLEQWLASLRPIVHQFNQNPRELLQQTSMLIRSRNQEILSLL